MAQFNPIDVNPFKEAFAFYTQATAQRQQAAINLFNASTQRQALRQTKEYQQGVLASSDADRELKRKTLEYTQQYQQGVLSGAKADRELKRDIFALNKDLQRVNLKSKVFAEKNAFVKDIHSFVNSITDPEIRSEVLSKSTDLINSLSNITPESDPAKDISDLSSTWQKYISDPNINKLYNKYLEQTPPGTKNNIKGGITGGFYGNSTK